MADPKPAVLTLHNTSSQVLTRVGDQMAYAIRWFFVNPGSTSSNNEEEMASFRKLNATVGNTPEAMAAATASKLETIARRYYSNASVAVRVIKENKFDADNVLQGTYGLEIAVADENNIPLIPTGHVKVSGNFDEIDCVFGEQGD